MNSDTSFIVIVSVLSLAIVVGLLLAVHWLDEYYRED